ncbi:hypothetical protein L249_5255 [Ophiocordyceps polyrhachis-furcata BCC 54312]|uniref:MYND-type domain-containing protein n=1 Tax=Ophiocordyceps polyrhachis-furcata BCC 54312 TaxID=1330021 RepID=A0A367L9D1_9HYPO|nr:hypothetical protein L249_5255 [Ophiocordyceps polyrhachis-furcata BCC 54312]
MSDVEEDPGSMALGDQPMEQAPEAWSSHHPTSSIPEAPFSGAASLAASSPERSDAVSSANKSALLTLVRPPMTSRLLPLSSPTQSWISPGLASSEHEPLLRLAVAAFEVSSATKLVPDLAPIAATSRHICAARIGYGVEANRFCQNKASVACPNCLLIAYCSEECRLRDWKGSHKLDCERQLTIRLPPPSGGPTPDQEPYWRRYAATDVLQLEKNEGSNFPHLLNLFFASASGLRHFIYTVCQLPDAAQCQLSAVFEEPKPVYFVRSFLAMVLLTASDFDPRLNAEAVIHMWYSSTLPVYLHAHINIVVLDVFGELFDAETEFPPGAVKEIEWGRHTAMLDEALRAYVSEFMFPNPDLIDPLLCLKGIADERNSRVKSVLLTRMTRSRALGFWRWCSDGLFLPYGQPRYDGPCIHNPIFFNSQAPRLPLSVCEPLAEWPMTEVLDYPCGPARNDTYGKAYYYLSDLLIGFQKRLATMDVRMRLLCTLTEESFVLTANMGVFDRIEVGDEWQSALHLIKWSHFLRHEDENQFATMLMLSTECATTPVPTLEKEFRKENRYYSEPHSPGLDDLAPPMEQDEQTGQGMTRRAVGIVMWRNWDKFSTHYFESDRVFGFEAVVDPKADEEPSTILQTGLLGAFIRKKHLITRPWPNRLVHSKGARPSRRDFLRYVGWPLFSPQRWLEWRRVSDVSHEVWVKWLIYYEFADVDKLHDEMKANSRTRDVAASTSGEPSKGTTRVAEEEPDDEGQDKQKKKKKKKKKGKKSKGKGKASAGDEEAGPVSEPETEAAPQESEAGDEEGPTPGSGLKEDGGVGGPFSADEDGVGGAPSEEMDDGVEDGKAEGGGEKELSSGREEGRDEREEVREPRDDAGSDTLVGEDVGSVVGEDVGSVVGEDVGSVVGEDVGSVIGEDVESLVGKVVEPVGGVVTPVTSEEMGHWAEDHSTGDSAAGDQPREPSRGRSRTRRTIYVRPYSEPVRTRKTEKTKRTESDAGQLREQWWELTSYMERFLRSASQPPPRLEGETQRRKRRQSDGGPERPGWDVMTGIDLARLETEVAERERASEALRPKPVVRPGRIKRRVKRRAKQSGQEG